MTAEQAKMVKQGSIVTYRGAPCYVISIKTREIAAPLFRLWPVHFDQTESSVFTDIRSGLISHRLGDFVEQPSPA